MTEARQLVTANRLRDGVPVYFAGPDRWSPRIDEALLVGEGEGLLAAAQGGPPPSPVVAPYLIDAVRDQGRVQPATLRERIRAFGPTI
jgi:hypothetical protein